MNNDEIQSNRLWNLRQLVRSCGGVNEAARIMGKKNSYITAISGPNPNRSIGNRMAAAIETAFTLQPGSLDAAPPKESRDTNRWLAQISSTLANASDNDKEFVLAMSQWLVGRTIKTGKAGANDLIDATNI